MITKEQTIKTWLFQWIAKELELLEVDINTNNSLLEYSLSSMTAMMLVGDLEDWLKIEIVPTLIWDYPSIDALVEYLATQVNSLDDQSDLSIEGNNFSSGKETNLDNLSEEEIDKLLAQLSS
jgi:acyl carrier protein